MGNESEFLKSQVTTLIRRRGTGNRYPPKAESRRMYRQEASEIQDEPRADLTPFPLFFLKGGACFAMNRLNESSREV